MFHFYLQLQLTLTFKKLHFLRSGKKRFFYFGFQFRLTRSLIRFLISMKKTQLLTTRNLKKLMQYLLSPLCKVHEDNYNLCFT